MRKTGFERTKIIQVFCGEACVSDECSSILINLTNHNLNQIKQNITTRFDRFVDTPQELPDRIIDLLHIAAYVFCADRYAHRGNRDSLSNSGWSRNWVFEVPVLDYDFWVSSQVSQTLSDALVFMTGDKSYEFHFQKAINEPLKTEDYQTNLFSDKELNVESGKSMDVMLFSGGLDSLAGAIERLNEYPDRQLCLINHMSNNRTKRTIQNLTERLQEQYPGRVFPYTFECRFRKLNSRDETQRTRMFLFSAIAFAICNYYSKDELLIYENGVTSLNLSKQTDVINARSSRTTHPKVIGLLNKLYSLFTDSFRIKTPYYNKTKEDVINTFSQYGEINLIQSSVSCSSTRDTHDEFPHCGCCSQCIDRRFATYAAGLQDVDFTYSLDVAQDPLNIETKQRVSALLYFADNLIGDSKYDFLKMHPQELIDIIEYWPGTKEDSLAEIYELYSRYRDSIQRAIINMDKHFAGEEGVNGSTFYARVTLKLDYEKESKAFFYEKIDSSVYIIESQSKDEPNQGSGFYLNDYGLITAYHIIEDNEIYNVCTCNEYPASFKVIGATLNPSCISIKNDYALFDINSPDLYFQIGDSDTLGLGDPVKLIGYPNHMKGDSYEYKTTDFTKKTSYFGHPLYEVANPILHGSSGGVVLDKEDLIVGLICAGINSTEDMPDTQKYGFVPINIILQDISSQGS